MGAYRALGTAGLLRVTLLLGVPKGLAFGAPSHRCGKSLHREQFGTEPYLTGQLRCLDGNLHGKRGLLLAVVESDDSRYAMPSRFQSFFDEFQLVATHGMGPTTPSTMGRRIRAPMVDRPGQLVKACQLALLGLSGASNEPLPGGKRPNGALCCHRFGQQLAAVPYGPSLSNLAYPPPKSWITTGKPTNAGARVLGWNSFLRELPSGWLRKCWSGFPGFLEGYSCLGLGAGLDFCTVGAVFGLLAGWGLFIPALSWPLVAAGMMVSVGLAGGVVTVSAITSSPTLVIFSGVRESRLSPSELELSLESRLFPRLRGVMNSDSRSFEASVGLGGGGGVGWGVADRLYRLSPQ